MARTAKKYLSEMTDAGMHDRLGVLKRKVAWNDKYAIPLTLGMGGTGIALAIAGALGLVALPFAPMTVFGIFAAVAPTYMGIAFENRNSYQREVENLSSENERRIYTAAKMQQRAEAEAEAAARRTAEASRLRLREEFEAALTAMAEGKGTNRDIAVGKPLRLTSRARFGRAFS